MAKPTVQNLQNDLNESYSPNILLAYSSKTGANCPSISF